MVNYPTGDFLIQIKNAAIAQKREVTVLKTNLIKEVAEALKRAGLLDEVKTDNGSLSVKLSTHKKEPKVIDIKLVSKPGLRIYANVDELSAHKGASFLILTTPHGVLTHNEALKKGTGGEVIAEII